jgi:hypothetical protein
MQVISDLDKARIERRALRLPEKKRPSMQVNVIIVLLGSDFLNWKNEQIDSNCF